MREGDSFISCLSCLLPSILSYLSIPDTDFFSAEEKLTNRGRGWLFWLFLFISQSTANNKLSEAEFFYMEISPLPIISYPHWTLPVHLPRPIAVSSSPSFLSAFSAFHFQAPALLDQSLVCQYFPDCLPWTCRELCVVDFEMISLTEILGLLMCLSFSTLTRKNWNFGALSKILHSILYLFG